MTKAVPTEDAKPIAAEKILNPAWSRHAEGAAQLIVKRDTGLISSKNAVDVRVDGEPVATLMDAEKVTLYVPPGQYVISVKSGREGWGEYSAEAGATAHPDKPQVFRVRFIAEQPYMLLEPTAY